MKTDINYYDEENDKEYCLEVTYTYYKGSPARVTSRPETSYPEEPCEIDITSMIDIETGKEADVDIGAIEELVMQEVIEAIDSYVEDKADYLYHMHRDDVDFT